MVKKPSACSIGPKPGTNADLTGSREPAIVLLEGLLEDTAAVECTAGEA